MSRPQVCGLLNLNKPKGLTSRRVVDMVARIVRPAAVGHAGTLDPLATGVLIVCVGRATRLVQYVQRMRKHYRAGFRLGTTSDTDDVEGKLEPVHVLRLPTREEIEAALPEFTGEVLQRPPAFSAVHVDGRRAYERARRGERVELDPRRVTVHALKVVSYAYPDLELEIECSSGTYVRAIGRDLGEQLGCGAVMASLERTAIGAFRVEDAVEPKELTREGLADVLLPAARAVEELPAVTLEAEDLRQLAFGQTVPAPESLHLEGEEVAVLDGQGDLAAIGRYDSRLGIIAPNRVLANSVDAD